VLVDVPIVVMAKVGVTMLTLMVVRMLMMHVRDA
jgi:hypothetical protein